MIYVFKLLLLEKRSKLWGFSSFTDGNQDPVLVPSVADKVLMFVLVFILHPALEAQGSFIKDEWY